jgi:CheY-like chemotaxis protein
MPTRSKKTLETILVVDDNGAVLRVVATILEKRRLSSAFGQ